jgi:hypothetical protein
VLCRNPEEAERERLHREQVLVELDAAFSLLRERDKDRPRIACTLLASRRYASGYSPPHLRVQRINPIHKIRII